MRTSHQARLESYKKIVKITQEIEAPILYQLLHGIKLLNTVANT